MKKIDERIRIYNCRFEELWEKSIRVIETLEDEVTVLADENAKLRLQICQLQSMLECEGLM